MTIHTCTVIIQNDLAAARVLARSVIETNPTATVEVLVIDDRYGLLDDTNEPFDLVYPDDIGLDRDEIHRFAALYDAFELVRAVKPWLLSSLLARWNEPIIYLDADVVVYGSLSEAAELASQFEVVLTPHITKPLSRDDRSIDESELLAMGMFNLGFIAVGVNSGEFLTFWKDRLYREGVIDPANQRFADQRWIDFVPSIFKTHILLSSTYNVGYWNLDHRDLRWVDGRYLIGEEALHFFHFSGYDPHLPSLLSTAQGSRARILLSQHPTVVKICDEYASRLLQNGYVDASLVPYAFRRSSGGLEIDSVARRAYRSALIASEKHGVTRPPNPFESSDEFVDWLNTPERGGRLTRYISALYEMRPDLRAYVPDAEGRDYDTLLAWCRSEVREGRLDYRLCPKDSVPAIATVGNDPTSQTGGELVPGVRVAGYFRAEMGVGELGRLALEAVRATGLTYSTLIDTYTVLRQQYPFTSNERGDLNVNLVCVNADALPYFSQRVGPGFFEDRYTIGLWAWELEVFPEDYTAAFDLVDEVWVLSEFIRAAVAAHTDKPVLAFPVPLRPPDLSQIGAGAGLGEKQRFTFLFCFDLMSVFERKNPLGLIEAFSQAFRPGEGPLLVIKALNGDRRLAALERLRLSAAARPDIVVMDQYLDPEENAALFNSCDCYVSLHRSEGLGLTMAEAMALGKPVIATGYSGNLDFMDDGVAYLVPYSLGTVPEGCAPYPVGAVWADPDLGVAAEFMKRVFQHPEEAAEVGARARAHILERHSASASAPFVLERFNAAQAWLTARHPDQAPMAADLSSGKDLPVDGETEDAFAAPPPLIALALKAPAIDGTSRFPRLGRLLRRVVRQLLANHDEHQREVNLALARGTEHLARLWNEIQVDRAQEISKLASLDEQLRVLEHRITAGHDDSAHSLEVAGQLQDHYGDIARELAQQHRQLLELDANISRLAAKLSSLQRGLVALPVQDE